MKLLFLKTAGVFQWERLDDETGRQDNFSARASGE